MTLLKDFREFAVKGNVIDLAVGVIIGGAFGKIVESLVNDMIMPIVGRIIGKLDFSNLFMVLADIPEGVPRTLDALKKAGIPVLAYGNFLTIIVNFTLLAFVIFMMIQQISKLRMRLEKEKQAEPVSAPVTPEDIVLLREIRDSLKR